MAGKEAEGFEALLTGANVPPSDIRALAKIPGVVLINVQADKKQASSVSSVDANAGICDCTVYGSFSPSAVAGASKSDPQASALDSLQQLPGHPHVNRILFKKVMEVPEWIQRLIQDDASRISSSVGGLAPLAGAKPDAARSTFGKVVLLQRVECTMLQKITEVARTERPMPDVEQLFLARDIAEIMQLLLSLDIPLDWVTMDNLAWSTEGCDEGNGGRVVLLPVVLSRQNDAARVAAGHLAAGPPPSSSSSSSSAVAHSDAALGKEQTSPSAKNANIDPQFKGTCLDALTSLSRVFNKAATRSEAKRTGTDAASATAARAGYHRQPPLLAKLVATVTEAAGTDDLMLAIDEYLTYAPRRFPTSGDPAIDQDARRLLPLLCGPCPESSAIDAAKADLLALASAPNFAGWTSLLYCIYTGLGILNLESAAPAVRALVEDQAGQLVDSLLSSRGAMAGIIYMSLQGLHPSMPPRIGCFIVQLCSTVSRQASRLLIAAGSLPAVARLLASDVSSNACVAALAIASLSMHEISEVEESGVIPLLSGMLESLNYLEILHAAEALRAIACGGSEAKAAVDNEDLATSLAKLMCPYTSSQLVCVAADTLASLAASTSNARRRLVADAGYICALLRIVTGMRGSAAYSAIRALSSLDVTTSDLQNMRPEHVCYLAEAVQPLQLMIAQSSSSAAACIDAASALTTIHGSLYEVHDTADGPEVLKSLIHMLQLDSLPMRKAAAMLLGAMHRPFSSGAHLSVEESNILLQLIDICYQCIQEKKPIGLLRAVLSAIKNVGKVPGAVYKVISEIVPSLIEEFDGCDGARLLCCADALATLLPLSKNKQVDTLMAARAIPKLVGALGTGGVPTWAELAVARFFRFLALAGDGFHDAMVDDGILSVIPMMLSLNLETRLLAFVAFRAVDACADVLDIAVYAGVIEAILAIIFTPPYEVSEHEAIKYEAVEYLLELTENCEDATSAVVNADVMPMLVEIIASNSHRCRSTAVRLLQNVCSDVLATSADKYVRILAKEAAAQAGAIATLVNLINRVQQDHDEREELEDCLDAIVDSSSPQVNQGVVEAGGIYISGRSVPIRGYLHAKFLVYNAWYHYDTGLSANQDAIEALVAIVGYKNEVSDTCWALYAGFEAGECLGKVVKGRNEMKMAVVRAGALPILVAALDPSSGYCRITATNVICYICEGCVHVYRAAIDAGMLDGLMEMLRMGSLDRCEMGECLACLESFATGRDPSIIQAIIDAGAINVRAKEVPILWYLEPISTGYEILECLLDGRDDVKQQFVDADGMKYLLRVCQHLDRAYSFEIDPLMRCFCHLTCNTEVVPISKAVIEAGALPILLSVVKPVVPESVGLAHYVVLNLAKTHCNDVHVKLIQGGVLPAMVRVLQSDQTAYEYKKSRRAEASEPSAAEIFAKAVEDACHTVAALAAASATEETCKVIVDAGVVPPLLRLFEYQQLDTIRHATIALCVLAVHSIHVREQLLKSSKAMESIVAILASDPAPEALHAARALVPLCRSNASTYRKLVKYGAVTSLLQILKTGASRPVAQSAIEVLSSLAGGPVEVQAALLDAAALPVAVTALLSDNTANAMAFSRFIADFAAGSMEAKKALARPSQLRCVVNVLKTNLTAGSLCPLIQSLGLLAEAGATFKIAVIGAGAVLSLLKQLASSKKDIVDASLQALTLLASGHAKATREICESKKGLTYIVRHLKSSDSSVAKRAAACLGRLSSGGDDVRQSLAKAETIPAMLPLLQSQDPVIVVITVEFLETMACGAMPVKRAMLEAGAVPELVRLLGHSSGSTWDTAAATLAWLAGGSPEIAAAVLQAGAMPAIASKLLSPGPAPQASAAISALSKFVSGPCAVKQAIASTDGVLARLVQVYMGERTPVKARKAVETILRCVARGSTGLQTAVAKAATSQGISDLLVRLGIVPVRSAWGAAGGGSG